MKPSSISNLRQSDASFSGSNLLGAPLGYGMEDMLDLKSTIDTVKKEGHMIRSAPFSFLTVCGVALALIWWGFSTRYSGKLKAANDATEGWKQSSELWQSESNYWKNQVEKRSSPYVAAAPLAAGPPTLSNKTMNPSKILHVSLLYKNRKLNGALIQSDSGDPKQIKLSSFQFKVDGSSPAILSVRLYLATDVDSGWPWQKTTSEESGFPTAMWVGSQQPVSPTETWNTGDLFASSKGEIKYPIDAKLKVFYGGGIPAEANFTIVKP
jgi:hypothetical protein